MKISGIYKIESKIKPERIYIGSAISVEQRWFVHINRLRKNKHHSIRLQNHFNKYGETDLRFSILLGCKKEELIKIEQYFIDSYNPWFNICKIAGSSLGLKPSKESLNKRSESMKGKNTWMKGRKASEETKQKMSLANKGKHPMSEKHKDILRNLFTGKELSLDHRKKLSESHKGCESCMLGKHHSEESKKKMSIAKTGRKLSEKTKDKMKESQRLRRLNESA